MSKHDTLEGALASVEGDIATSLRAVSALTRELKKANAAAAGGTGP